MPSNAYTRRMLRRKALRESARRRYGYVGKGRWDGVDKTQSPRSKDWNQGLGKYTKPRWGKRA